jgi:hypothetical protein
MRRADSFPAARNYSARSRVVLFRRKQKTRAAGNVFDSAQTFRTLAPNIRLAETMDLPDRRVVRLLELAHPTPPTPTAGPPPSDLAEPRDISPPKERMGHADPERQLWCAVIIHTLYEASGRIAYAERGEHERVRQEAVAWFQEAGEDFDVVCDMAGFPPAAVRDNALRVIRCGRLPRMRIPKAG